MERKRRGINLFDIVIIVVICAVGFVGYKYLNREKVMETKSKTMNVGKGCWQL